MISSRVGYSPLGIKNTSQKVAQRQNNVAFSGNRVVLNKKDIATGAVSLAAIVGIVACMMNTNEKDLTPKPIAGMALPQRDTGVLEQFNKEIDSSSVMKSIKKAFSESGVLR